MRKVRRPSIALRPAKTWDSDAVLAWRNDPAVYRWYRNARRVGRDEHRRWYKTQLGRGDSRIWIICGKSGQRLGQVRLDRRALGLAEVSVCIDPRFHGRGYGTAALCALPSTLDGRRIRKMTAEVLRSNSGSLIAFIKAGFEVTRLRRDRRGWVLDLERSVR